MTAAGWAGHEPAAGCDTGLSQNTSVLSPLRARVWGDDDYRHFVEFKSAWYFWSEVLHPHVVREHACRKVLQASGVRRNTDETRGGLVPWQDPSGGPPERPI